MTEGMISNGPATSLYVNGNEIDGEASEDKITIWGYQPLPRQKVLYYFLSVISLGFFALILFWKPYWKFHFLHCKTPLDAAKKILVRDSYNQHYYEDVQIMEYEEDGCHKKIRFFVNRKLKYLWNENQHSYELLKSVTEDTTCQGFHAGSQGLTLEQQSHKRRLYGANLTDIDIRPIGSLIWHEALNPYYVFQIYSFVVWSLNNYYGFALVTLTLSVGAILLNVWQTRKQILALRDMIYSRTEVQVHREGQEVAVITSDQLVPGDVINISSTGCVMECDAVILNGTCIVNESMLTGESVPLTKTALPKDNEDALFDPEVHSRHVLYCGTQVIQTRARQGTDVLAIVLRTGFSTKKGAIVRSIIFPKPINRRFYQDGMRLLISSLMIGLLGMIVTGAYMFVYDVMISEIILNTLDIMTFVVPPYLPALLTLCNVQAQKRLQLQNVFCLSCKFINSSGILNVFCFDKTGTLTNDGLDLWGLVTANDKQFGSPVDSTDDLDNVSFLHAMASCHSLTYINNKLSGYPIDIQLFEATKWTLEEDVLVDLEGGLQGNFSVVTSPGNPRLLNRPCRLVLLKQYAFSSNLQRQTVIAAEVSDEKLEKLHMFIKGSPEKVAALCNPSTIPDNFVSTLMYYTKAGFRVLAMAHRQLPVDSSWDELPREAIESDSEFLGLVVMENALKPETRGAITVLHDAAIRTVMVTGDNLLTAIQIGFDCGMLRPADDVIIVSVNNERDVLFEVASKEENERRPSRISLDKMVSYGGPRKRSFAMDGRAFDVIRTTSPDLFQKLMLESCVFARMLPEQKAQLVDALQGLGYSVGMCGDGANDCGALRTADAGVSLSVAEASVASPFTSRNPNISCVPVLIREGRCSLMSSFGSFKMLLSVYYVIFISALVMYSENLEFHDNQFLYMDLVCIMAPVAFFGGVASFPGLIKRPPPNKMFSVSQLFSMITFILIQSAGLISWVAYVKSQDWYEPNHEGADRPARHAHGTTVVYLSSCFMALGANLIFSQGAPYRRAFYTNKPFTVIFVIAMCFNIYQSIYPAIFIAKVMQLKLTEIILFRVVCVAYFFAVNLICYIWETFINQYLLWLIVIPWLERKWRRQRPRYLRLSDQLENDDNWPPLQGRRRKQLSFTTIPEENETETIPLTFMSNDDNDVSAA